MPGQGQGQLARVGLADDFEAIRCLQDLLDTDQQELVGSGQDNGRAARHDWHLPGPSGPAYLAATANIALSCP